MPLISDEPVFSSDDRSQVIKVKHRKSSSPPSNYQPEAFFEPSKEDIIKRPVSEDTIDKIDEMMDKVKSRFFVTQNNNNNNNNNNNVLENEKTLSNEQKTITTDDESVKKERLERIRARWAKLGPIIKSKEIRRFSTTTPKTFELDKKQYIESNFDTFTEVNHNDRPVLHSVKTMTDDKFLGQNEIKNLGTYNHIIKRPPIAKPTFGNELVNLGNLDNEGDLHNRLSNNFGEQRRTHYKFVNKVSSRPRLRIRRPGNPPTAQAMENEVARAAGISSLNRGPLSLPELSPITNEESNENQKIKPIPLPSIEKSDETSRSFKSDESSESLIDSSEITFGNPPPKSDEKIKPNKSDEFDSNSKSKEHINVEIEPPLEPTDEEISSLSRNHKKKKVKVEEVDSGDSGILPQNSGLRPVAPPSEFGSTGGFGSGFGGGSAQIPSGFGFGGGMGSPLPKPSKTPSSPVNEKTIGMETNKDENDDNDGEDEEDFDKEDTAFGRPKGPSPDDGSSEGPPKPKGPDFNQEELFTGDSAFNINSKGPTGDGYGPPISSGAAVPPPVHGINYGGGAAGIGGMGMVESYTQNPPTTVKPSALLNILNKADQGINQAITHFERGSPVETAAIDILEVALGSQRLDSQAKLLGHVDRTFGLDNLQRLQRWANTGGALDMLKEQFAKIAKNYRPPADLLPTIPPQLEYLFSPSNNGKK
uniref:PH domain-containing protein n=1 Tax=Strongyloides papillosus TaxID=174720 RepID=A0A0N5BL25_STREA